MQKRPSVTPRGTCVLCLGWLLVVSVASATAGEFRAVYEPTQDPTADALRQQLLAQPHLRVWTTVLNELFVFPTDVTVVFEDCGRIHAFYDPAQRRISLCYELLTYFSRVFPRQQGGSGAPEPLVLDATLFIFFHTVGHALIHGLGLPVTGGIEEAADEVALVSLVAGHAEEEQAVRAGVQALFQSSRTPETAHEVPFWAAHPWSDHRYARLLCWLSGGKPERHTERSAVITTPEGSAQPCPGDLQRRQQYWDALLAPHLRQNDPLQPPPVIPPPAIARVAPPPEQFIRTYYHAINQRQYAQTWAMLSPNFKQTNLCCDPRGNYKFSSYTGWWDTIRKVDVLGAKAHESHTYTVRVLATLRYHTQGGSVIDETHRFSLREDLASGSWLIDEQTRGERAKRVN